MTRVTALAVKTGTCAIALALFFISQTASAPTGAPQIPAQRGLFAGLEEEIKRVEAEIDRIFAETLAQAPSIPSDIGSRMRRVQTLGKLELFDKQLSVNRNQACAFCHMPDVDFTGPISILNLTTVSYPGSVRNASADPAQSRYGRRKPQSYTYSPYFPVLQYNQAQEDFYGGNFWDMRATGVYLQNPAAEQAQGPPVDPNEMGLPDTACVVRRLSQSPYRWFFEAVWGTHSFAITWPADVDQVCGRPGPAPSTDPLPVHLSPVDRGRSNATYDHFALAIAAYEAAPEVSPFSSKFDYALANPDQRILSPDEQAGWDLFRGKAKCNTCHLDGTESLAGKAARKIAPGDVGSKAPLFTDFTSSNLGIPRNPAIPYYNENQPDRYGYIANPAGSAFVDKGVGDFLRNPQLNPNADWARLAPQFDGRFQVSTLRNVDKRPRPDFVKAYMHNGYFKSLKEVVHFYNTRDKLPRCPQGPKGEKLTCWPAPEVPQNIDTTIGNLGLTMARSVFWPSLLHGGRLERFCSDNLPETFAKLSLPFAAVATAVPGRQVITITEGRLSSAISASCAIPYLRRPVARDGRRLVDGGVACVMPSTACRELGAEFIIASDVWEYSSLMRAAGCHPARPTHNRFYPGHYLRALHHTDLHIHPSIPIAGYAPGTGGIERMIAAGEKAAHRALARLDRSSLEPSAP